MTPRSLVLALALTLATPTLASCSDEGGDISRLTVLAASSLTDAFAELETTYEAEHSEVDVALSFDSSSILAEQVIAGAPADVLATADETTMQTVVDEDLLTSEPIVFAQNTLVLVTPVDNPASIDDVSDLEGSGVTYAACVPEAPCGDATQRLLELIGVKATPITEEDNVRSVLTKVTGGDVDAGFVYVSDAQAAGDSVQTVEVDRASEVINSDPIAVVARTELPEEAQDWVDLVLSAEGQRVLASYGFGTAA